MEYKKIIKSQSLRIKIMQALSFLPDTFIIRLQYRIKTGRHLNLKSPKRYTEKIQWYKLHYLNPLLKKCVDKYEVREYVAQKGLSCILNENYGVYDRYEDIDLEKLPERFVCKDTLAGGSTSVIIFDKSKDDIETLKQNCENWTKSSIKLKHPGREWPYDKEKHRIIIEAYLEQQNGDLADYKFYCFAGHVECFYVRTDYMKNHQKAKMAFFNRHGELLDGVGMDYCKASEEAPALPENLERMITYAEKLSSDFPHVRVDFFNVDGKIVFGELTFYNASGYMSFFPDEYDYELGSKFMLKEYK